MAVNSRRLLKNTEKRAATLILCVGVKGAVRMLQGGSEGERAGGGSERHSEACRGLQTVGAGLVWRRLECTLVVVKRGVAMDLGGRGARGARWE